jgi:glycosyltransferase involved in cell wall biosynthesis
MDLSIVLSLHDAEPYLARLVKGLVSMTESLASEQEGALEFEVLAMDERSRDNTLAILSLLSGRIDELQAFQDIPQGTAIMRASRLASGKTWLVLDHDVDLDLARWATSEVMRGHRAASVSGQLLALEGELAEANLAWIRGGLVAAQREIKRALAQRDERMLRHPNPRRRTLDRLHRRARAQLARFGLARFDRPLKPD